MMKRLGLEKLEERKARERSERLGVLDELWRKKRERMEEEGEKDEIFRDSKKTPWSPTQNKGKDLEGIIRECNREIKEVLEEMKGIKRFKKEMAKMKEDIRKELRE